MSDTHKPSVHINSVQHEWHPCWNTVFDTFDINILKNLYSTKCIYPAFSDIFKVFSMDVVDIRIVLLGQDPYHGHRQAHGLSFSVPDGVTIPPSLRNIFKELIFEFPERAYTFTSGNLTRWFTEEKIFLLNASLTVEEHKPGSHMALWSKFTNNIIQYIATHNPNCIFLLMGNFAKEKIHILQKINLDITKRIVTCVHPSPLSAHRGFFNCGVFTELETRLGTHINWNV